MTDHEIEELLGAYALDAVDPEERVEIEAHLTSCPRCRSEVVAHREVAALLANGGAQAPDGLWERISKELSPELLPGDLDPRELLARLPKHQRKVRRRSRAHVGQLVAAAAVTIVIALLSLQVENLSREIHQGGGSSVGISAAVDSVLSHQHRTIVLTSARRTLDATVVVGSDGNGFWVDSNLRRLPNSETYQLWTIVNGADVVSLGVIGPNPKAQSAFRLQPNMSRLMVTVEPEGGTPAPTVPVLVSASI